MRFGINGGQKMNYIIRLNFYVKSGYPFEKMDIEEEFTGTKDEAIKYAKELMEKSEDGLDGYTKEIEYGGYSWMVIWYEDGVKLYIDEDDLVSEF